MQITKEYLKNPIVCFGAIREYMFELGEDFLDQNCCVFKVPPMVMWMLGKGYISKEEAEKRLECACTQDLLRIEKPSNNLKEEMVAYTILAEYFSIFDNHRERLLKILQESEVNYIDNDCLEPKFSLTDEYVEKVRDCFQMSEPTFYDEYIYFSPSKRTLDTQGV